MMNHVRSIVSCCVALSFAIVACGDDDADDDGSGASGGKSGSAGSSSKAGTSGKSGKGGAAGSSSGGKGGSGGSSSAGKGGSGGSSAGTGGNSSGGNAGTNSSGNGGTASPGGEGGEAGTPTNGGAGGDAAAGMSGEAGTSGIGGSGGTSGSGGTGTAGASGASDGGEGGAPVIEPDVIDNPGFEQGTNDTLPVGWTATGSTGAATYSWSNSGGAHSGPGFLDLWLGSDYTVDVSQVVSPLPDGSYTLSIWHYGGAYTEQYVYVTGYDASDPEDVLSQATSANSGFVEIVIADVPVTNGQIKIGIHSVGPSGAWSHFDDVTLTPADQ